MNAGFFERTNSEVAQESRHLRHYTEFELGVLRGWKTFALFATDNPCGDFRSHPVNDAAKAVSVCRELGLIDYESLGQCELNHALYPRANALYVGAYAHGIAIAHCELPYQFFETDVCRQLGGRTTVESTFKEKLLALYPSGQILSIILHSVQQRWGYCLYSAGQLVRCVAGSAQTGLITDIGNRLLEEESILSSCALANIDELGYGEDLVFDVTSRFFGHRLDEYHAIDLEVTEFRPKPPRAGSRLIRSLLGLA